MTGSSSMRRWRRAASSAGTVASIAATVSAQTAPEPRTPPTAPQPAPTAGQPASTQPMPTQPVPARPVPAQPIPTQRGPAQPAPVHPMGTQPGPAHPPSPQPVAGAPPGTSLGHTRVPAPVSSPTLAVLETTIEGVDPKVGTVVTDEVAQTAAEMGFTVTPRDRTQAALAQLGLARSQGASDAWRVARATGSNMAISVTARARAGAYVIEMDLAKQDGSGPFAARGSAGANDLRRVVASMTRTLLLPHAAGADAPGTDAPPDEPPLPYRWRLAGQTEASLALSPGFAYGHLVGARLDYQFARGVFFGPQMAYANLEGPEGRVHNALMSLGMEYQVRLSKGGAVVMPLRLGSGYLPKNGPVLRTSAGLAYVGESVTIGLDLLAPRLWIVKNRNVFSLDVALDVAFAL